MFAVVLIPLGRATAAGGDPFAGRWDLTIVTPKMTYPSWMEVTEAGGSPEVKIVGRVASVHPAKDVKLDGKKLSFSSREYLGENQTNVTWVLNVAGGKVTGTQTREDGTVGQITALKAPALIRKHEPKWGEPIALFNGKDLAGWTPDESAKNHYKAIDGALVNQSAGANIHTDRKFEDFKLHIEFNCPQNGNSGVYLRGRYEVQVEYEPDSANDKFHRLGSIYGFVAPAQELPKKPGEWETYDITLIGRKVTIIRDGVKTIDNQEIPGITGGALDSDEGKPGPINIQGDHTGGMKYRNIMLTPAK